MSTNGSTNDSLIEKDGAGFNKDNEKIQKTETAMKAWSVEDVLDTFPGGRPIVKDDSPVPFFHLLERLKTTKREGWRRFGISAGESISDHMYRMSIITMCAPKSLADKLDIPKCIKMALVHDMAEALVGDITPVDGVPKVEKNRRESITMEYLTKNLLGRFNSGSTGKELMEAWQEYEDNETLESKFVHDVDKIELVLQMIEYEHVHNYEVDLAEFAWVATRIVSEEVKAWAAEVMLEREKFWGSKGHDTYRVLDPEVEKGQKEYYGA